MSNPQDPLQSFCFAVSLDVGKVKFSEYFRSVSGLKYQIKAEQVGASGSHDIGQIPGASSWSPLSFKRGFTREPMLLRWVDSWANRHIPEGAAGFAMQRATVTISLLPLETPAVENAIYQWVAEQAFPTRLDISDFDASKSDIVLESLELVHQGLTLSKYPSA